MITTGWLKSGTNPSHFLFAWLWNNNGHAHRAYVPTAIPSNGRDILSTQSRRKSAFFTSTCTLWNRNGTKIRFRVPGTLKFVAHATGFSLMQKSGKLQVKSATVTPCQVAYPQTSVLLKSRWRRFWKNTSGCSGPILFARGAISPSQGVIIAVSMV
jgi:hypothetical protein